MPTLDALQEKLITIINETGLSRLSKEIIDISQPAILVELIQDPAADLPVGTSKVGGDPDLPAGYPWPEWKGKPMGFIGQFDLSAASRYDVEGALPKDGLLSFFYDLYEMPGGYDPKNLGYSHIAYFPAGTPYTRRETVDQEIRLPCSQAVFSPSLTVPVYSSRDYKKFVADTKPNRQELESFEDLSIELQAVYRQTANEALHQLLGHAHNIQGDMQLKAELVTNGIYFGDQRSYKGARRKLLEPNAGQWRLLFQLDTDGAAGLMWGDLGMLYYWIKRSDLLHRRFEKHWMDLQCC